MSRDREHPPTEWLADVVTVDSEVGIYAVPQPEDNPWWVHWCKSLDRWEIAGTPLHTLVALDPLHLEASLLADWCCGLHGWIRDGKWVQA